MPNLRLPSLSAPVFALLFILISALQAQESDGTPGISVPPGFYQMGLRYGEGKNDSLFIRWSHNADADSFWVYKKMAKGRENHLEFFADKNTKTVWYSKPVKYERRMATHHLREFVFDSPIRFSDLLNFNLPAAVDLNLF